MSFQCTFDIIKHQIDQGGKNTFLHSYHNDEWTSYTYEECAQIIIYFQEFLKAEGFVKGDLILIMPQLVNSHSLLLDMAVQSLAMVSVLIHSTTGEKQLRHILEETEAKHIFFNDAALQGNYSELLLSNVESYLISDFIRKVAWTGNLDPMPASFDQDSISTIIYTSGTTGKPKGVMLSHKNLISNVASLSQLLPLDADSRVLSFLPYSHAFERTLILVYLTTGTSIYMPEYHEHVPLAFGKCKPHIFSSVPRIIEKMYDKVQTELSKKNVLIKKTWHWALNEGSKYRSKKIYNPITWFKLFLIRKVIFRKFRKQIGGEVRAIIVGAAYLNPRLSRLFSAAGVPVREGYGLTEASPVVTVNRMSPGLNRYGTVGIPLASVKVKLVNTNDQGEGDIFVKGPSIMKGYYKKPVETSKVLGEDGWLNTGDVGRIIHGRFLQITDRKKDLFKTSTGKYIAPSILTATFSESIYIDQLLIIGFQRPFLTAIIYPDFNQLKQWALQENIHWTSDQYMVLNIKVKEKLLAEIQRINNNLAAHQRIKEFHLTDIAPSIENGQLSATLKIVRHQWMKDYQKEIESLYNES